MSINDEYSMSPQWLSSVELSPGGNTKCTGLSMNEQVEPLKIESEMILLSQNKEKECATDSEIITLSNQNCLWICDYRYPPLSPLKPEMSVTTGRPRFFHYGTVVFFVSPFITWSLQGGAYGEIRNTMLLWKFCGEFSNSARHYQ